MIAHTTTGWTNILTRAVMKIHPNTSKERRRRRLVERGLVKVEAVLALDPAAGPASRYEVIIGAAR